MGTSDPLPHVLLIGGDGGPSGVPRHIAHLAQAFQGIAKVTVASDANRGGYDGLAASDAIHVTVPGLQTRLSPAHLWRGWRGLLTLLRTSPADVIWLHARFPVVMGRVALALRLWRPTARVAVTFHGLPFGNGHRPQASRFSLAMERFLLSACPPLDLVFLTEAMARDMAARMGPRRMARHRVHVLPNCSDLGPLPDAPARDGRRLVMTGRVGWQKNYELAARVLTHLPGDFTLTLCGSGTDATGFQTEITANVPDHVAARITFAGPVNDVRQHLMAADAYLLCSRYEGMPIGALEAFEAGLPIILSRFSGAAELAALHPCGLVLDFDDLGRDAAAIASLVDRFDASDVPLRARIRSVWNAHWSPHVFAERARRLLQTMLGS